MTLIIAGGRDIKGLTPIVQAFNASGFDKRITKVIAGGQKGVDRFGIYFAKAVLNLPIEEFPADWDKHGRAAGPIRNEIMANNADALLAIWDGQSPGTKDMIKQAQDNNLEVYIHLVKPNQQPNEETETHSKRITGELRKGKVAKARSTNPA